jgi:hypothetical protein
MRVGFFIVILQAYAGGIFPSSCVQAHASGVLHLSFVQPHAVGVLHLPFVQPHGGGVCHLHLYKKWATYSPSVCHGTANCNHHSDSRGEASGNHFRQHPEGQGSTGAPAFGAEAEGTGFHQRAARGASGTRNRGTLLPLLPLVFHNSLTCDQSWQYGHMPLSWMLHCPIDVQVGRPTRFSSGLELYSCYGS